MTATPSPEIAPVSTVESIRRALEQMAFAGGLEPGTPLREQEIAERFAVSRHSVKAALVELVRDGVAVHKPNRGVFARRFSREEVVDLFKLRGAVEAEAVRLIRSRRRKPQRVDEALARLTKLERSPAIGELVLAGVGVHRALVEEAESERLLRAFDSMLRELRVALAQAQTAMVTESPRAVLREHHALVEDLWGLSPRQAVARIREHTDHAMNSTIAAIAA